jgi:hypothetical protein
MTVPDKPARKITNTGTKKNICKFSSAKMGRMIWCESLLEKSLAYLLEIDPDVVSFTSQPFKIEYVADGRKRRYTPDYFVERRNKKQVVEVKPANKACSDKYVALFQRVGPICREQGWEFIVATDEFIRLQPRLNNVKLLNRYARVSYTFQNLLDCEQYFKYQGVVSLGKAAGDLQFKGITRQILFKLIYSGFLQVDIMKPINSQSSINLSNMLIGQK